MGSAMVIPPGDDPTGRPYYRLLSLCPAAGSTRSGDGVLRHRGALSRWAQLLTAPSEMPAMSCLEPITKTTSSGAMAMSDDAMSMP